VHCGMCLPACPTYRETGREQSSPRGRIYLMRGVAEGRIELGDLVRDEAHLCLGCRACETVCPSGVQYGAMVERTREEVMRAGLREDAVARLERVAAKLLPARLGAARALLPPIPPRYQRRAPTPLLPARGERRGRVGF